MSKELYTITLKIPQIPARNKVYGDASIYVARTEQKAVNQKNIVEPGNCELDYVSSFLAWNVFTLKEVKRIKKAISKEFEPDDYPPFSFHVELINFPITNTDGMHRIGLDGGDRFNFHTDGIEGFVDTNGKKPIGDVVSAECRSDGSVEINHKKPVSSEFFQKIILARKKAIKFGGKQSVSEIHIFPEQKIEYPSDEIPF